MKTIIGKEYIINGIPSGNIPNYIKIEFMNKKNKICIISKNKFKSKKTEYNERNHISILIQNVEDNDNLITYIIKQYFEQQYCKQDIDYILNIIQSERKNINNIINYFNNYKNFKITVKENIEDLQEIENKIKKLKTKYLESIQKKEL